VYNCVDVGLYSRLFDVSKQVVGQMFVHGANVFVSGLVSQHTDGNACVFYFLHILLDTTLGKEYFRAGEIKLTCNLFF
jgi:hypothetical protein